MTNGEKTNQEEIGGVKAQALEKIKEINKIIEETSERLGERIAQGRAVPGKKLPLVEFENQTVRHIDNLQLEIDSLKGVSQLLALGGDAKHGAIDGDLLFCLSILIERMMERMETFLGSSD